ncbi:cytidylate kinase [Methanofollis formosanus]|uniref:Cytidylate kinase n=1 Tax=Methanofollis formosanus TaxID=299308 RepID=A0A8G1EFS4_9EURY|nr:AAA family ATPase [Methanofollis formosanus]QYZ79078.1 cytidylate kinase [Methanofollis formosanus]
MRITISGPPGSGTTSLARYLAEKHGLRVISAGEMFRALASERGMSLAEFGKLAESDAAVDKLIDARQKETAEAEDNIVAEGRLSGWMVSNADLKIWLSASFECRTTRISSRDGEGEDDARRHTEERQVCERGRYLSYYGIDIDDFSVYDLVLSSERWDVEGLGAIVDAAIAGLHA